MLKFCKKVPISCKKEYPVGLYIISVNIQSIYDMLDSDRKKFDNRINEVNATRKGV